LIESTNIINDYLNLNKKPPISKVKWIMRIISFNINSIRD
jgi:hypothetical protein